MKKITMKPVQNARELLITKLREQINDQNMLNLIDIRLNNKNNNMQIQFLVDVETGQIHLVDQDRNVLATVQKNPTTILADISTFILSEN